MKTRKTGTQNSTYSAELSHKRDSISKTGFLEVPLKQIRSFFNTWDTPERRFLDVELEEKRIKLYSAISCFLDFFVGKYTTSDLDVECIALNDFIRVSGQDGPVIRELNKHADNIIAAHEDLILTARAKLKC